jgi:hypothetical protein
VKRYQPKTKKQKQIAACKAFETLVAQNHELPFQLAAEKKSFESENYRISSSFTFVRFFLVE